MAGRRRLREQDHRSEARIAGIRRYVRIKGMSYAGTGSARAEKVVSLGHYVVTGAVGPRTENLTK